MTKASPPLVPADVDLRNFPFMPLDVVRLRDSDLVTEPDGDIFRANVLSWCIAWHQVPAASLPDDDATLARLLGYGRDLRGWRKARAAGGLRGWVKCADGRLYHPVVAEKALAAWNKKQAQRQKTEAARKALADRRQEHLSQPLSQGDPATVEHLVTASKGEGMEKNRESPSSLRSEGNKPSARAAEAALLADFETWYAKYPRKEAKAYAVKAYRKARRKTDAETLLAGIETYKRTKPDYQDWAHPTTWLNGERWLDGMGGKAQVAHGPAELHADFAPWEAKMRRQFNDAVLRSYFKGAELSDDGTRVKITVPRVFSANYINENFTTQLRLVFEPRSCEVSVRERAVPRQPVANEAAE